MDAFRGQTSPVPSISCYLIVAVFAMLLRHKINFRASELANHHLIAPSQKLKIDYIFKREAEIVISAGENVVSKPRSTM